MFTVEDITNFEDLQIEEFDALFESSLPHMEVGTYSWEILNNPNNQAGKRDALLSYIESMLQNNAHGRFKCNIIRKDGHSITIFVGAINSNDDDYITWSIALYGPDASGSKSWLYDADYSRACKAYWTTNYNVLGYRASCINDQSLMNFHLSKPGNVICNVQVGQPETVESFETVLVTYTYI